MPTQKKKKKKKKKNQIMRVNERHLYWEMCILADMFPRNTRAVREVCGILL